MFLFTISYGSCDVDQRSGDGWFSGWFEVLVICKRNSNAYFEVLDARNASALNRIIHNSHFKRRVSLEEQKPRKSIVSFVAGRLLTWSTSTSGSQEPTILSRTMPTYSLLVFEMTIFRNSIRHETESYFQWPQIHLTKSFEGLYKLRIRESEKLKTVFELYDLQIHQKKIGPDYHRLKTMVKRSIEQEIRNKNLGSRNGNFEKKRRRQESGDKQRGQRILGDCWPWETNGQCERKQLQFPPRYG